MSEQEADELRSMQDHEDYGYNVYSVADLQQSFDLLWGAGRIDIDSWKPGGDCAMYITESGYILAAMLGYGDNGSFMYKELSDIVIDENIAKISFYAIEYNYFDLSAVDYGTSRELGDDIEIDFNASFDEVLSLTGVT